MCMPRIFGTKFIDGKIEDKKKKCNIKKIKKKHKIIHQSKVEFE